MITVENLRKSYGTKVAVDNVAFHIPRGEFYGLLGPNGAGKTTILNILTGVLTADRGNISILGMRINKDNSIIRKKIGVVPQELALYEDLSAYDNLKFWGKIYGMKGKKLKDMIAFNLDRMGLSDRAKDKVRHFSGGMKRRLNIAIALMHEPEILFLDEPTVGIDPQSRNLVYESLSELSSFGKTIVYTSHYMDEVEQLCDRVGIIDKGKIIAQGTVDELRKITNLKETIHLKFSEGVIENDKDIELFVDRFKDSEMRGNEIAIPMTDSKMDLLDVVSFCTQHSIDISSIDVEKASLQNIFLRLTGKELRD
ncbi:MAG: ABC transporter ATP-binding protein [Hyphomicrobiales bacterium]